MKCSPNGARKVTTTVSQSAEQSAGGGAVVCSPALVLRDAAQLVYQSAHQARDSD